MRNSISSSADICQIGFLIDSLLSALGLLKRRSGYKSSSPVNRIGPSVLCDESKHCSLTLHW